MPSAAGLLPRPSGHPAARPNERILDRTRYARMMPNDAQTAGVGGPIEMAFASSSAHFFCSLLLLDLLLCLDGAPSCRGSGSAGLQIRSSSSSREPAEQPKKQAFLAGRGVGVSVHLLDVDCSAPLLVRGPGRGGCACWPSAAAALRTRAGQTMDWACGHLSAVCSLMFLSLSPILMIIQVGAALGNYFFVVLVLARPHFI